MIQNENNGSKKIKENKYKILRMSLLLGTDSNKEETINNFEDAAREIDFMNNETYLNELDCKFYETKTLEEESEKLAKLVDYIAGRISQRESLISDFINVTGRNLTGLGEIKYENKLIEYQDRLKYINEYLDNTRKISEEKEELEKLETRLNEEEYQKKENETKNEELENLLRKKFISAASDKIEVDSVTEDDIEDKLATLRPITEESKKSLDIFTKSFETLKNAGLNYEDEVEYRSYVEGARDAYYENKEEEYLLELYKLLLSSETEYTKIFTKRESISNLLNNRLELRQNLQVKESDCLEGIYNILAHQSKIVEGQKENIDNIANITAKINYCKERINELEEDNEKVEILSILKEYNIIDTYEEEKENNEDEIKLPEIEQSSEEETESETDSTVDTNIEIPEPVVELPQQEETKEENKEESSEETKDEEDLELPIDKPYRNNFVMGSHEPLGLNVDECVDKAKNVMRRVGKMLKILPDEVTKPAPVKEEVPTAPEVKQAPIIPEQKEEVKSPFLNQEANVTPASPFLNNNEAGEMKDTPKTNTEESNVKNVLPSADSFWNKVPKSDDDSQKEEEIPVSNDDFFANNMDNFEFPNLDEFK